MRHYLTTVTTALALCACVSSGSNDETTQPNTVAVEAPDIGLPSQRLADGECGLFLWSQTDISKFTFFSKAATRRAMILIGDEAVDLAEVSATGELFGQFRTELAYQFLDGDGGVELQFTPGEDLIDGQRISSGRIVRTDPEGWQTITPVIGVRACVRP